jgi:hypothetical protein
MALNDLQTILTSFQKDMTDVAVLNGAFQASEKMKEIKASGIDEIEQRKQLDVLGRDFALRLAGVGADGTQIQTAMQAIAPPQIKNAADANMQGELTGSSQLQALGQRAQTFENVPQTIEREDNQAWTSRENALNRANNLEVSKTKKGGNRLPITAIKEINQLDNDIRIGSGVLKEVENDPYLAGVIAGRIPFRGKGDPKFAKFKQKVDSFFNSYRQRITGAAASDTELQLIKSTVFGEKDSPSEFIAKAQSILEIAEAQRANNLQNYEDLRYDVGNVKFKRKGDQPAGQPASQQTESTTIKSKTYPDPAKILNSWTPDGE